MKFLFNENLHLIRAFTFQFTFAQKTPQVYFNQAGLVLVTVGGLILLKLGFTDEVVALLLL